jgi:Dolichyl-phosphate-mannose-protein mannosyltransferase
VTVPTSSGASRGQSLGGLAGRWMTRWAPTAGLLFVAALLSRVPGLVRPWFERDEAYIGVQAEALLRGQQLYVDVIDRKPPLAPVVYAAVAAVFGTDFRPVRLLLVLWIAVTAVLLVALIIELGGSHRASVTGGVLYVLGTVAFMPRDGQAANFELWAVLPAVAAVFVAVRAGPTAGRPYAFALAGALVGIAACFKQPFLATLVPVGLVAARGPRPVRSLLAGGSGLVVAVVVIGSSFGLAGMTRWVWMENDEYAFGLDLRVLGVAVLVTALFAVLHAPAVWLAAHSPPDRRGQRVIVFVWLLVSVLAVAAGLRFRLHYYQQALPPLCVLAGIGSDAVRQRARTIAIAATAVVAAVAVGAAFIPPAAPTPQRLNRIVQFIDAHTGPDDPILVWGAVPEIYWRSDRPVAGRFVHHRFLVQLGDKEAYAGDAALDDPRLRARWDLLLSDMRARPPVLVLDASHRDLGGFGKHHVEDSPLGQVLRDEYTHIATVSKTRIWKHASSIDHDAETPTK